MKQGISLFSFQPNANIKEIFTFAKEADYDGVEPVLGEEGYLTTSTTEKEILEIKKMADDMGLEIPSVGVWSLWENNLVSDNKSIAQKAFDIVQKQIEIANLLGADTILVVPGYVGCEFSSRPEKIRYDIAYDRSQEAFSKLAPIAEKAHVNIGIENVWNKFLLSPMETVRFVDEIGSKNMGVYFDVGNVIYIGYPEQWIEILGSRIKKIHLSDCRFSQAGIGAFVDLFAGDVDFKEVAKSLAKIGYDDYIILEMLPNYKQFPEVSLFSNKYAVERISNLIQEHKKI